MHKDTIITIGRQFGAGGREIGRRLADSLGIPFYDSELLTLAARRSGLSETVFQQHDEQPADSLFYASWTAPFHSPELPLGQQVSLAQFKIIKELGEKGGCVVVGRAADFVLDGRPHLVRVFLHEPLEDRVKRVCDRASVSPEDARKRIRIEDRHRAAFYNYFTDRKWGDTKTYDLCLNTALLSTDAAVAVIRAFADAASPG